MGMGRGGGSLPDIWLQRDPNEREQRWETALPLGSEEARPQGDPVPNRFGICDPTWLTMVGQVIADGYRA